MVNDKSDMPPRVCRACQRGHCDGCVETLGADGQTDCKCSFKGHPWRDADYYRLRQEREPSDLSHLCGMDWNCLENLQQMEVNYIRYQVREFQQEQVST